LSQYILGESLASFLTSLGAMYWVGNPVNQRLKGTRFRGDAEIAT